jgi:hypothetical protein
LNVDNLIAEPPGVGDMLDRLHIAADFESTPFHKPNRQTVIVQIADARGQNVGSSE